MRSSLIIFEYLNDNDIVWIHQACRKVDIASRKVVIESGKPNQDIYILLEGKCRVEADDGRALDVLISGDIVGEVSFVDRRKTTMRVTADSNAVLACLDGEVLSAKLASDAPFAARFYRGIASVLAFRLRRNLQTAFSKGSDVLSGAYEFVGEIDAVDLDVTAKAGERLSYVLSRLM